ncbi:FAD-linked oxidase [Pseudoclavibacter endophyticus]|uniref:FAD-binding protein n=1 Tax=Pseudoclavibacter endophyticus TaxID=1778590 RepID=A0A6H9WMC0_9MICO|nr:FAD-linked oxidase C-terminal domain-containing protein [Pseudoclavibacter endophyticus]KAB1648951.1 FAD-binding protein [Pseudoclavibacter endophyticus]GGA66829.1 FAD-linked oxidase [Pseudoclavibacter endophyticus]
MSADVVARLERKLPGRVVTDPEALEPLRRDRSGAVAPGRPLAVVFAESVGDVQAVCRTANETGTPLVTRGAGSGLAGGAIAGDGELVLSTERMTRILEISIPNQLAVVEPGLFNGDLNRQLAAHGLWWPPDPASKEFSTVGGNIAMNAGGLLCAKYGVTRESVLALKVVLADGSLLEVGHRTVKGVTGYDLCALMIGSEGTLGVIVEATLKVRPAVTGTVPTIGAYFDSIPDAAAASAAVTAAGLRPAIMELLDTYMLQTVGDYHGIDLISAGAAYLLIQTDGPGALDEAERILAEVTRVGGRAELTTDPETAASLVDVRRSGFIALEATGRAMLVEDVAVPRDRMPDMYARIAEISAKYGVDIPAPSHAGDGNLHPSFLFDGSSSEVPEYVWQAAEELFTAALELGGTLSGEHGIGTLKRRFLGAELGAEQYELQRRIKQVFDPKGILNPGKVFAA